MNYIDIVYAQAIIESGSFKSGLCRNNNNIFGMRLAHSRKTTAIGTRHGYAKYEDWKRSVDDYVLFQNSLKKMTREQYLKYLNKRYSATQNYSFLLLKTIKNQKDIWNRL